MTAIRLVYTYNDGHQFVTEAMLLEVAERYMPMLGAVEVGPGEYEAPFGHVHFEDSPT